MTASEVQYVLDELGTVVDAQPADHPLRRVDRDNSLVYESGGDFDMNLAMEDLENDLMQANYVGARFADRDSSYIGTTPNLDTEAVVGVRIIGYSGGYGHVDPEGVDGVLFQGTDSALVERCMDALRSGLKFPDAGRTDVGYTHLTITNEAYVMAAWQDFYRADFDVVLSGFETLFPRDVLEVQSGQAHIVNTGDTERYDRATVDGTLLVDGTLELG